MVMILGDIDYNIDAISEIYLFSPVTLDFVAVLAHPRRECLFASLGEEAYGPTTSRLLRRKSPAFRR